MASFDAAVFFCSALALGGGGGFGFSSVWAAGSVVAVTLSGWAIGGGFAASNLPSCFEPGKGGGLEVPLFSSGLVLFPSLEVTVDCFANEVGMPRPGKSLSRGGVLFLLDVFRPVAALFAWPFCCLSDFREAELATAGVVDSPID